LGPPSKFAREVVSIYDSDDILPGQMDLSNPKPNRFAAAFSDTVKVVILDSDTAQKYHNSTEVNDALRTLMGKTGRRSSACSNAGTG
jgi:hypothetical protein